MFGFCYGKPFPSAWNLACLNTNLWNPENGNRYTQDKLEHTGAIGRREGMLRFVLDIDASNSSHVWLDGYHSRIALWEKGSKVQYFCVCFKNNSKHKVTLLSFRKLI
eukprot:TRINITY_DN841_c0_g2_i2.p1 TRINITY_DN841_c0_g2~~TRINITY_DN841_c0_g2_i2.p1  ORF type:complete len:107 (-),score=8.67 TRINITY_DN841_c0_g2_i2:106-426(-)